MPRRKRPTLTEVESKIETLLHKLTMRRGRSESFRAGKSGKTTAITSTSIGKYFFKKYLWFIDNDTGDVYDPVYAYGDRYRAGDEVHGHIDDLIESLSSEGSL